MSEQRRLVPFEPHGHPNGGASSTNGHRPRASRAVFQVVLAWVVGALVAASFIGRTQWLNLYAEQAGWVGRLAVPAAVAGLVTGLARRHGARDAAATGAIAGVASLWAVYGLVRIAIRVLWVDRSIVATVASDLGLLALVGSPAGGLVSIVVRALRMRVLAMLPAGRSGP